ncbi:unnamed protein product [Symbiodinium necroappetens]|uniref:Uncharacterized protein n=1 Tax=Symbiodinium necroappetens TaxID=1628268 RepID=A0A812SYP2_9DINO|nr:unnamed protein product [Symbiodinium necroappetens]
MFHSGIYPANAPEGRNECSGCGQCHRAKHDLLVTAAKRFFSCTRATCAVFRRVVFVSLYRTECQLEDCCIVFRNQDGVEAVSQAPQLLQEGAEAFAETVASIPEAVQVGARRVQEGLAAVARSVSRSFSAGPSYAHRHRDKAEARAQARANKEAAKQYQKLQWTEAMERNLQMLKIIIEHRRNQLLLAEMEGDWEKKAALETEVKDLKVRQARLSCALWVQPEDLPSSMQLLESENPQQLQQELELLLEKLGLVPPRKHGVFDARELVAPTLEQAQAIAETKQESEPAPEPAPAVVPALASVARDAENLQQQTLPLTGLRLPLRTSSNQKGKEGKGGKAGADAFGKGSAAVAGASGPNNDASAGQRFVEVREEPGSHEGAGSPGKASVKGPPGKGKGKKGPPMPSDAAGADGKGKGQKGPALPAGKGGRIRKVTPLGRRFHWKELPADKLQGTVFDDIHASNSLEVQFDGLKSYFADDDELGKAPGASSTKDTLTWGMHGWQVRDRPCACAW